MFQALRRVSRVVQQLNNARLFSGRAPVYRFPFDENVKLIQRENAVKANDAQDFEYLRDEVGMRVVDRMSCIQRSFPNVIDVGCNAGAIAHNILQSLYLKYPFVPRDQAAEDEATTTTTTTTGSDESKPASESIPKRDPSLPKYYPGFTGLEALTQYDVSHMLTSRSHARAQETLARMQALQRTARNLRKDLASSPEHAEEMLAALVADAGIPGEATMITDDIPTPLLKQAQGPLVDFATHFQPNSTDMITSSLAMHWINDLPKFFKGVLTTLKPDGVFIGAMLGGNTLQELRSSLVLADTERLGGVMPHISPLALPRDIGDLMTAAGFNMVSVDVDTITVSYPDMFTLIAHLQSMGENGAPMDHLRAGNPSRDVFLAAAAIYEQLFKDDQDLLVATFDVMMIIGWKPDASHDKFVAKRGSATHKIGAVLE